jgi:hypothetical protein
LEYAQLIQDKSINRPGSGWVEEVENGLMNAESEENVNNREKLGCHKGDYGS